MGKARRFSMPRSRLLIMVSKYDYELSDKTFQNYCSARGILHVAGEPEVDGGNIWQIIGKQKCQYPTLLQLSEEVDGKRHSYTDEEMETGWKIMLLGRAKFQDCRELYSRINARGD